MKLMGVKVLDILILGAGVTLVSWGAWSLPLHKYLAVWVGVWIYTLAVFRSVKDLSRQ